jgi:putative membrane protein
MRSVLMGVAVGGLVCVSGMGCSGTWGQRSDNNTGMQTTQPTTSGGQSNRAGAGSDTSFARDAATGGLAEVQMGQVGVQQGSSTEVRQFAQRMVDDHTQANNDLMRVAQQNGIDLPDRPTPDQQQMLDQTRRMTGTDFDRSFMRHMVDDHRKVVAAFEQEAANGMNPDLKAFAQRTLPTLREHLRMAQEIAGRVGA